MDHILQHQKEQRERLLKSYNGTEDLLEKSGEGSRGGHIIGHTKSGKPIYKNFKHKLYQDFTKEDHSDAFNLHNSEMTRIFDEGKYTTHPYNEDTDGYKEYYKSYKKHINSYYDILEGPKLLSKDLQEDSHILKNSVVKLKHTLIYSPSYGGLMTKEEYEGSDEQISDKYDSDEGSHVYSRKGTKYIATEDGPLQDIEFEGSDGHCTSLLHEWLA